MCYQISVSDVDIINEDVVQTDGPKVLEYFDKQLAEPNNP
jgi:hypothetical protein